MKTIYISGKIDGCDLQEVRKKFNTAEFNLCQQWNKEHNLSLAGFLIDLVVNPARLPSIPEGKWFDYMMRDLIYLKHCDTIYMLKDWKDSAGARVEHEFAKKLGLEIIYEENERLEQRNEAQELVEENHAS